ncbi:MAG: hypothetical protein ACPH3C_04275, partial [Glaciecola sp.]
ASITKLMTALLLYENFPLNHEFITSYPSNYAYSGKVAFAIKQLIENQVLLNYDNIIMLHTGGLQGLRKS